MGRARQLGEGLPGQDFALKTFLKRRRFSLAGLAFFIYFVQCCIKESRFTAARRCTCIDHRTVLHTTLSFSASGSMSIKSLFILGPQHRDDYKHCKHCALARMNVLVTVLRDLSRFPLRLDWS
jgi:hypothetical protein